MAEHKGKKFKGQRLFLDGNSYEQCTFENCTLVYGGGQPPKLSHCGFTNSPVTFEGAAERTLAFLQAMAHPNSGLQQIIRDTFKGITLH